jgi:hypothetical protein
MEGTEFYMHSKMYTLAEDQFPRSLRGLMRVTALREYVSVTDKDWTPHELTPQSNHPSIGM